MPPAQFLRAAVGFSVLAAGAASSMYVAYLCQGEACTDPRFPILDYNPKDSSCHCLTHPCWNDNGVMHRCEDPMYPFLTFGYTEAKELICDCAAQPFYGSVHISRDWCPGHACVDPEYPILDYNATTELCHCRKHPCLNDNGVVHQCTDAAFPILHYREDPTPDGKGKPTCECLKNIEVPHQGTDDL